MVFTDSHAHLASVAEEFGAGDFSALLADYAEAAMTPKSMIETPPMTGAGMLWIAPLTWPKKAMTMEMTAAPPTTQTE